MKTVTPFWPLFKHEMGLRPGGSRWGIAVGVLGYWFGAGTFPYVALYGDYTAKADITTMFRTGFLPIFFFLLATGLSIWTTFVTVPAFSDWMTAQDPGSATLQNSGGLEYLFTRAVDRRKLFRARTVLFLLIALTPFFVDLALSGFAPPVVGSLSVYKYLRAFPLYHPQTDMVIPHCATIFSAWITWLGLVSFFLLQGYGALIAKRVRAGNLWTLLFPAAPILVVVWAFGLVNHYYKMTQGFAGDNNLCENSFLFFATHPLAMVLGMAALGIVIQIWCERRFSRLEVL